MQVVGYTLNALSRTRAISQPVQISPTLLRFNIAQFASQKDEFIAWSVAWEKLAEGDPYFHLRTEVLAKAEGGKGKADGTNSENHGSPTASRSAFRVPNSALKTVTTDGGWVDLIAAARMRAASGSIGAILRADYFVAQATIAPRYYEFAGVPETENEFLKSLGVDQTAIDRLRANAGANLIISGVTAKPRRVVWAQGPLGGVYSTLDVAQVDAERDPLRRPISAAGFAFRYDVSEWFAVAPNGLWRTALFDAAGKRQNSVPDKVAKDTSDPLGDGHRRAAGLVHSLPPGSRAASVQRRSNEIARRPRRFVEPRSEHRPARCRVLRRAAFATPNAFRPRNLHRRLPPGDNSFGCHWLRQCSGRRQS